MVVLLFGGKQRAKMLDSLKCSVLPVSQDLSYSSSRGSSDKRIAFVRL